MAQQDSSEEKRLPASEKKLRKARLDGQVPRSRDLGHIMLLAGTLGCFGVFLGNLGDNAQLLLSRALRFDGSAAFSGSAMVDQLSELVPIAGRIVVPLALAGVLASIAASAIPGGMMLVTKPLKPKFDRMSPLAGIKRLFSKNHLIDSFKLSGLVGALTLIAGFYTFSQFETVLNFMRMPLLPALDQAVGVVAVGAASLLAMLALVAMIDVPLQWVRHRTQLKMTFQEAKQENKETEGDPYLKSRLRQRQREIGTARMMAAIPAADVIVNNPTHFSVALKYDESGSGAPRVIAKGADHVAMKIRELAKENDIPQLEAPPLARALYAHVAVDQEIPGELFSAVAQVLAWVFQLRQATLGNGNTPEAPVGLSVPAGFDPTEDGVAEGAV